MPVLQLAAFAHQGVLALLEEVPLDRAIKVGVSQASESGLHLGEREGDRLRFLVPRCRPVGCDPFEPAPKGGKLLVSEFKLCELLPHPFIDSLLSVAGEGTVRSVAAIVDVPLSAFANEGPAAVPTSEEAPEEESVANRPGVGPAVENAFDMFEEEEGDERLVDAGEALAALAEADHAGIEGIAQN